MRPPAVVVDRRDGTTRFAVKPAGRVPLLRRRDTFASMGEAMAELHRRRGAEDEAYLELVRERSDESWRRVEERP